ncbi:MAG: phosphoribosylformylglycinamidine synthase subunit PurL, partial [Candidatus Bathyarchaeia archaeon]
FELTEINVLEADDKQLLQISAKLGIGLNLREMKNIQRHFSEMRRNPTDVELQSIGQTWSEHCFHKTFKGEIVTPEEKPIVTNLFKEYIAKVTRELDLPWCLSVFEDNAGIINFDKGYGIAVKVETHNHPSAIDPFGGASTGLGGVIRDILGVWADPIACTDVLCFGPLDYDHDKLPSGTKHPKELYSGVVAGVGHYGNNMGVPTVNGAIYFDESYVGNIAVFCGCIGILPMNTFISDTKPGDVGVLAGARTGRFGIHGVTFASAELTKETAEAVELETEKGNPAEEEKIKRALIKIRDQGLGSAITDLGGGGLSCAAGEMAYRSNCGIHVELEKAPLKHSGMAPWEIYISESQERMLLSVREKNLKKVLDIFEGEGVEAAPIAKFTDDKTLKVDHRGQTVANLDLQFLFSPPRARRVAKWTPRNYVEPTFAEPTDFTQDLLKILSSPNVASKESVIRTFNFEAKGNTSLKPLQGKYGGPNDAAVVKPLTDSWKGIVISCGMNPNYGKIDPYWMAASGIDEAIRNNVAVGGRRISLLDNFTWGSPEKPDRMGGLVRACKACYDFAKAFGTPFISGKDSLYNESVLGPVTPTLLFTAIGIIPDVRKAVSVDLKRSGDLIYLVGQTYPELGGSQYYKLKGFIGMRVPKVRITRAKRIMNSITEAIDAGCIKSCHDLSEGGLAAAAAEMALGSDYGMELNLANVPVSKKMKRTDYILFSESNSRFLVEVPEKRSEDFEAIMKNNANSAVGKVKREKRLSVQGVDGKKVVEASLNKLREFWKKTLK